MPDLWTPPFYQGGESVEPSTDPLPPMLGDLLGEGLKITVEKRIHPSRFTVTPTPCDKGIDKPH